MLLVITNSREEADALEAMNGDTHAIVQGQIISSLYLHKLQLNALVNLVPKDLRDDTWLESCVLPFMDPGFLEMGEMPIIAKLPVDPPIIETSQKSADLMPSVAKLGGQLVEDPQIIAPELRSATQKKAGFRDWIGKLRRK